MFEKKLNVCVFCSSSEGNSPNIIRAARDVGEEIARKRFSLVFGGKQSGLMNKVAKPVYNEKQEVIGIVPKVYTKTKWNKCSTLIEVNTVEERKQKMFSISDAFILLPGGIGSLEEFFAALEAKRTSLAENKPIVLLNIDDYFDGLLIQLADSIKLGHLKFFDSYLFSIQETPKAALEYIEMYYDSDKLNKYIEKLPWILQVLRSKSCECLRKYAKMTEFQQIMIIIEFINRSPIDATLSGVKRFFSRQWAKYARKDRQAIRCR